MAISYNVYANDGRGGDVDYSTPIATTTGLSFAAGPLAAPSDNTFAVRAFDVASGIEEANTDARVRVVIDAAGNEVTSRPNVVRGLSVRRMAGGTCRVVWGYDATGQGAPPSRFVVTLAPGSATPAATIAHLPGVFGYECSISGLADGTRYTVAVQAVGASDLLAGVAASASIDYRVTTLSDVDSLAAVATP